MRGATAICYYIYIYIYINNNNHFRYRLRESVLHLDTVETRDTSDPFGHRLVLDVRLGLRFTLASFVLRSRGGRRDRFDVRVYADTAKTPQTAPRAPRGRAFRSVPRVAREASECPSVAGAAAARARARS